MTTRTTSDSINTGVSRFQKSQVGQASTGIETWSRFAGFAIGRVVRVFGLKQSATGGV
ncbi:hypothetical protein [Alicyclobacillus sp. SP_1]|jgi:hypothetical protein|uniref:hypothetical protein n=1 Tax=Alicyclobacillus sp. SP_1 TaxID=2942475 RepID=UPI0021578F0C|nr:hypothetical protein [Alicyclobacillus sp. SP_1]